MATNISIRGTIEAIVEIMGENGAKVIFNKAGFPALLEKRPDYNFEPCIKVSQQAQIYRAIVDVMGLKGAVVLWRRIGYTMMKYAAEIGHILDGFDALGPHEKFNKGIDLVVLGSGKGKAVPGGDGVAEFDGFDCLTCAGYRHERPICGHYEGSIQYLSDWAFGKHAFISREVLCKAKGDDTCYVTLVKSN
jgi:predicted hydrocarbon binding protein